MKRLLSFIIVLMCSSTAYGGIINTLPEISDDAKQKLALNLASGIDYQTGNNDVLDVSAAGSVSYSKNYFNLHTVSSYVRNGNVSGSDISDHATMTHIRLRYLPPRSYNKPPDPIANIPSEPGLAPIPISGFEIFTQHEYDEFRNLDTRALVGAGLLWRVLDVEKADMVFGTSYMFEYLNIHDPNDTEFNRRLSSYIQLQINPAKNVTIRESVFFQFKAYDVDDFVTLNDISLEVDAFKWLALKLAFTVAYDSKPPFNIQKMDTSFVSGIVIKHEQ